MVNNLFGIEMTAKGNIILLFLICPVLSLAAETAPTNRLTGVKMETVYRDFISYVKEVQQTFQNGKLSQPNSSPPGKDAIFVGGFGWIQPSSLDWYLTLRPLQLKWDSALLLVLVEEKDIDSAKPDQAPQWLANMELKDGKWVLCNFTAVCHKLSPGTPKDIPNQVPEDIGTNAPNFKH